MLKAGKSTAETNSKEVNETQCTTTKMGNSLHGIVLEETGLVSFYRVGLCAFKNCADVQCHAKKNLMEFNSCSEATDLSGFRKENIKYFNSR